MRCKKCMSRVVLCAFDEGNCKSCNKKVFSANIPCNKLCDECSIKENKCEQCNQEM